MDVVRRREVLDRDAQRLVDRDVVRCPPPGHAPQEHVPQLAQQWSSAIAPWEFRADAISLLPRLRVGPAKTSPRTRAVSDGRAPVTKPVPTTSYTNTASHTSGRMLTTTAIVFGVRPLASYLYRIFSLPHVLLRVGVERSQYSISIHRSPSQMFSGLGRSPQGPSHGHVLQICPG